MEINIPNNIQFTTLNQKVKNYDWELPSPMKVCFKHAVAEVMRGEDIETELIEDSPSCFVCRKEGKF